MPTGYTAIIHDREDATFAEFLWTCARAFGAFLTQRDDPSNTPPVIVETPDTYYEKSLMDAEERLRSFDVMSDDDVLAEQERQIADIRRDAEENIRKTAAIKARYEAMLATVDAWTPPSRDHQGLKDFMAQQLDDSIRFDCGGTYWHEHLATQPMDVETYRRERRTALVRAVERARTSLEEERARVAQRNEWKRALAESVPVPSTISHERP